MWNNATVMMIVEGTFATLYMTLVSTLMAYVIGLPVGVALVITNKEGLKPNAAVNRLLDVIVNIMRSIPFLILLALAPVPFCTMGTLEYDLFSLWIWAALAGIGLQLMLSPKVVAEQETPVEEPEKEIPVAEETPISDEEITEVEESASLEEEHVVEEEVSLEEKADVHENVFVENDSNPEANSLLETTSKPVQYLHNPLPVPKKHVKRVADYKVNVVEDDDFDFDIHEDDDFDF